MIFCSSWNSTSDHLHNKKNENKKSKKKIENRKQNQIMHMPTYILI
jgi:hypothetical protein